MHVKNCNHFLIRCYISTDLGADMQIVFEDNHTPMFVILGNLDQDKMVRALQFEDLVYNVLDLLISKLIIQYSSLLSSCPMLSPNRLSDEKVYVFCFLYRMF